MRRRSQTVEDETRRFIGETFRRGIARERFEYLTVRAPEMLYQRVARFAVAHGCSRSEAMCRLLDRGLGVAS